MAFLRKIIVGLACISVTLGAPLGVALGAPVSHPTPLSQIVDDLAQGKASHAVLTGRGSDLELRATVAGRTLTSPVLHDFSGVVLSAARQGHVPLDLVSAVEPKGLVATSSAAESPISDTGVFFAGLLGALAVCGAVFAVLARRRRAKRRPKSAEFSIETRFSDVYGSDDIAIELEELATYLRNPERFRALDARAAAGVILVGAPGSGKTFLARAIAGEAGVPFFGVAGFEWRMFATAAGQHHYREFVRMVQHAAPAVVCVEDMEHDQLGAEIGSSPLSQRFLLRLLSDLASHHSNSDAPILVCACAENATHFDPSALREMRVDDILELGYPDHRGRFAMLQQHLANRPIDADVPVDVLARMTSGLTGGDLAELCTDAARTAARVGSDVIRKEHLYAAMREIDRDHLRQNRLISEEERRLMAYHEIGHALIAHVSPSCEPVARVTVIPHGRSFGLRSAADIDMRFLATRTACMERMRMMLAGRAAEELVFGECTSGAEDDLQRAGALARRMSGDLAMSEPRTEESLLIGLPGAQSYGPAQDVEVAAQILVRTAFARAMDLLVTHREQLELGAGLLLEHEILDQEDLMEIFGSRPGMTQVRHSALLADLN